MSEQKEKGAPPSAPAQSEPEILTVDEAARLLKLVRNTVYTLVEKRQLPGARRLGKSIRIHRATLIK